MTSSDFWHVLSHPFTLGLLLGLVFAALAFYQLLALKLEMKRYKRHLSDKLEIEAEAMKRGRTEQETLKKENENLRMKVATLNDLPDHRLQRDVEIFARAEKRMLISVPGFAPAWENAKADAALEIEDEESGRSLPKRVFTKLFGPVSREEKALSEPGGQ
ncbi:MAG: hypothetical protein QOD99_1882 [Chthoniobacter sp.]|jgi:hypothetical protein|nr:hypothetical protein [Chthoniobacter sp.]